MPSERPTLPIDPAILFDALRLVRQARVSLSVPLAPGPLFPGLAVKEGTVARVEVQVRDGELDLPGATVELLPALDGPLFTRVKGIGFGANRRLAVRLGGFPDLQLGPPVPSRVEALSDWLRDGGPDELGVRLFGVKVGKVSAERVAKLAPDPVELLTEPQTPGAPQLEGARVQVTDVVLDEGVLLLGPLGRVRVGCEAGGSLELSGGEARLEADLRWSELHLTHERLKVADGEGRAVVRVEAQLAGFHGERDGEAPTLTVHARLEDLQLRASEMHAHLPGGDFAELSLAHCAGGTVDVEWRSGSGSEDGWPRFRCALPRAGGTLTKGRVTLPIEGRPVPVEAESSSFDGSIVATNDTLAVKGALTVHGRVAAFQPTAMAVSLDLYDCELHGDADVELDLQRGAVLRGRGLRGRTRIREARVQGWLEQVSLDVEDGSTAELELERLVLTPSGDAIVEGEGELALRLHRMFVRHQRATLEGDAARLEGRARVRLDTREGVELDRAQMALAAAHWGLGVTLGNGLSARMDGRYAMRLGGARVDVEREKFELDDVRDGNVRADITRGWVELPAGHRIRLRDGSRLELDLREAVLTNARGLTLRGPLSLSARLEADDDLLAAVALAGLDLGELRADRHHLRLTLDGLEVAPDGSFLVRNLRVGVQSEVDAVSGRLVMEELR